MKLLSEFVSFNDIEVVKEVITEGEDKKKEYYLKGPFLEAGTVNRNGRKYMLETLQREVKSFYENKIKPNRSLGELDHPPEPTINLDRVSHLITGLEMKENVGYGCAKLIDTPMGRIAKSLVDEGILLGMSTRGVGTLDGDMVKDDYTLITVDIVADPSAKSAFVEGVLENKEFIVGDDGEIVEKAIENLKKKVDKKSNKFEHKAVSELTLQYMLEFIKEIDKKNN